MHPLEIIIKKRNGQSLTEEEIGFLVNNYTAGKIPDYQMASLLMAVYFQGMNLRETIALSNAMARSGKILSLKSIKGIVVDKHSTGGVGDGISLVLAPLVAAAGVPILMMCGRGLGHTGGTVDKLESIPGFRTNLTAQEAISQVKNIGAVIIGQTQELAPADGRLYALRDVTATVENDSLICASIISKKIAAGVQGLVLDVKCGSGAFMPNYSSAKKLAELLLKVGKAQGLKMKILITNMDQPLGRAVGNGLEVEQALEVLRGRGPRDFKELTLALGAEMLLLSHRVKDRKEAKSILNSLINTGQALNVFSKMVKAQGGEISRMSHAKYTSDIKAPATGYVYAINTREIGLVAALLGAGRMKKDDSIDPAAGIILCKKMGDYVNKGDVLAEFYYSRNLVLPELVGRFKNAISVQPLKPPEKKLILWSG